MTHRLRSGTRRTGSAISVSPVGLANRRLGLQKSPGMAFTHRQDLSGLGYLKLVFQY